MLFSTETTSDGVTERQFTVGDAPGVVWVAAGVCDSAAVTWRSAGVAGVLLLAGALLVVQLLVRLPQTRQGIRNLLDGDRQVAQNLFPSFGLALHLP